MSGNQLRASAELHAVTVTEEGVETLVFGAHDEAGIKSSLIVQPQIQDASLPSSSQTQDQSNTKRIEKQIKPQTKTINQKTYPSVGKYRYFHETRKRMETTRILNDDKTSSIV